jgi:SAM-dependent methyltransferase
VTELYDEHADLYDLAFDWDVSEEVAWLHERLGAACRSVLEPGCGSGRILEAFARRGLHVAGIDRSPAMAEAAKRRLEAAGIAAEVFVADITDFDLVRRFDGAVCPINTLLHLAPSELARHLARMADHLEPGGAYLVQLAIWDAADPTTRPSRWQATRGETTVRVTWTTEDVDLEAARLRQRSRIEILSGSRAGDVVEETHALTAWTSEAWAAAVAASPFSYTAAYAGDRERRPPVAPGSSGPMLWHQLTLGRHET